MGLLPICDLKAESYARHSTEAPAAAYRLIALATSCELLIPVGVVSHPAVMTRIATTESISLCAQMKS